MLRNLQVLGDDASVFLLSFCSSWVCSKMEEKERRKMGLKTYFNGLFIAKSKRDLVLNGYMDAVNKLNL